jgi:hypothetical protein
MADGFKQRLKEDGRRTLDQRKRSAADRVAEIAQALGRTGAHFSDNEPTLADLANRLAGTVGNLATRLREGSIDDPVADTRAFARRNPAWFIAGGVLAGFAIARFVKASPRRTAEADIIVEEDEIEEVSLDEAPTLMDEVIDSAPEIAPRARRP